jgi:hypothetical protein
MLTKMRKMRILFEARMGPLPPSFPFNHQSGGPKDSSDEVGARETANGYQIGACEA